MSPNPLPEDWKAWPRDPYTLLGVAPGVAARDLRKAYTTLIRQYKPEQYPEQFRLIRDAYEAVQRYGQFLSFAPPPLPEPTPEGSDDLQPSALPDASWRTAENANAGPARRPATWRDELDELWDRACAGDVAAAYRRCQEVHEAHPEQGEVLLRLYWLLVAFPEVDAQRSPRDWLARGLCANGLTGPCRELYRREVEAAPREALSERFQEILRCPARAHTVAELVEWRWRAASALGGWRLMAGDLEELRPRFAREDEEVWTRLLLVAADHLAWVREEAASLLLQRCCQEIEEHAHVHGRLGEAVTRLDILLEVSTAWKTARSQRRDKGQRAFFDLVPLSWMRPPDEVRPAVLGLLEEMAGRLLTWLNFFDALQAEAPSLLAQFGQTLDLFPDTVVAPWSPGQRHDPRTALILGFLKENDAGEYASFRLNVLRFGPREGIAPEQVAQVVEAWSELFHPACEPATLLADWPLRYVCKAHRLFWG